MVDDLVKEVVFDAKTGELVDVGVAACETYLRLDSRVGRELVFVDCSEFNKDEWELMKTDSMFRAGYGVCLRHLRKTGIL